MFFKDAQHYVEWGSDARRGTQLQEGQRNAIGWGRRRRYMVLHCSLRPWIEGHVGEEEGDPTRVQGGQLGFRRFFSYITHHEVRLSFEA
jgi:hypothetical protein